MFLFSSESCFPLDTEEKELKLYASLIIFLEQDIHAYCSVNVGCCTHNFWGCIWGMYNWNPFEDVQRHSDRCLIDAKVGMSHLKRIPWAAVPHLQHSSTRHEPYSIWGLSSKVQWCGNRMAISPGSIRDVWASPITWDSVGPQLCRPHWDRHCHAAEWCCQWVCCDVFLNLSATFEAFDCSNWNSLCRYMIQSHRSPVPTG